jgi:hypothetical protein
VGLIPSALDYICYSVSAARSRAIRVLRVVGVNNFYARELLALAFSAWLDFTSLVV